MKELGLQADKRLPLLIPCGSTGFERHDGINPDNISYRDVLKACGHAGEIYWGFLIHENIIKSGTELELVMGNALVDMYAKCGKVQEARKVFDSLPNQNSMSWGSMIAGYSLQGHGHCALRLFENMHDRGIKPNKVIFLCILKACRSIKFIKQGRLIQEQVIRSGFQSDLVVGSTLVDMYSKCGSVVEARKVFDDLPNKDGVAWGAMIGGYAQCGQGLAALELFKKLQHECVKPSKATFTCILKACGSIGALTQGRQVHQHITECGLRSDVIIASALVDMYVKCGSLEEACEVFDESPRDVVSWGAMIAGYAANGLGLCAIHLFKEMQQEGLKPQRVTFLCILKACSSISAVEQGRLIHGQIIKTGLEADLVVGNTLIDMYVKCGRLEEAHKMFNQLPNRDDISWDVMMAGYNAHEDGFSAFDLFENMQHDGVKPNETTSLSALKACGMIGAIKQGKIIHNQIIGTAMESDMVIGNALVDMYGKCGCIDDARNVFDELLNKDVVSYGTMIAGYALHGNCLMARQCFEDMLQQGLKPVDAVFTSMLTAFNHGCLLEEGCKHFKSMMEHHSITPSVEHYSCMIDLLGRAGHLIEAGDLLQSMPALPDIIMWRSLLTSCRHHGNMELGRQCFNKVVGLDSVSASGYVLMSSIYSEAHMWEEADIMQALKEYAGAWKKPGTASIEVNTKVQEFIVGDTNHLQVDLIYAKLKRLSRAMKEHKYVPGVDSISGFDFR